MTFWQTLVGAEHAPGGPFPWPAGAQGASRPQKLKEIVATNSGTSFTVPQGKFWVFRGITASGYRTAAGEELKIEVVCYIAGSNPNASIPRCARWWLKEALDPDVDEFINWVFLPGPIGSDSQVLESALTTKNVRLRTVPMMWADEGDEISIEFTNGAPAATGPMTILLIYDEVIYT